MKRRKRRSREDWAEIVAGQGRSDLTARAFCRRKDIGLANFYNWRRRLRASTSGSEKGQVSKNTFVDLGRIGSSGVSAETGASPWVITLDLGEGFKVTLQRG